MNLTTHASNTATDLPAFATPDPIAVSIELSVGDVRVVASDRADTVVQVRPSDAVPRGGRARRRADPRSSAPPPDC